MPEVPVAETPEAPEPTPPDEGKLVAVAFDSTFPVADDVTEVSVSVAASGIFDFKIDGTPVKVEPRVAELLVQSPAVKEVN